MIFLNKKNVLECNEIDFELHMHEVNQIIEYISCFGKYDCAILMKYLDEANRKCKTKIIRSNLEDIYSVIDMCDCKNGMDIYLDDEQCYVLIIYGQNYEIDTKPHIVTTLLKIMPFDKEGNFLKIKK